MKNYIKILLFLFIGTVYAQQESIYSLYRYNMNVINPAYAGTDGGNLTFLNRSQWSGVQDAPETQNLIVAIPLGEKIGLGFSGIRDKVFVETATNVSIDFSYKLQVAESTDLFLGLKAGATFLDVNLGALGQNADPLLSGQYDEFNPNVGIGAYLKGDRYFVSLSAPRMLNTDRVARDQNGVQTTATDRMHVYLMGGYTFDIGDKVTFTPSALTAYVKGADPSITLNGTFGFLDRFELGAGYRLDEAFAGLATVKLDWFKFGYAYEGSTDRDFRNISGSSGTHEIFVSFSF